MILLTCQGNPISAYLFILVLEILFILTKSNKWGGDYPMNIPIQHMLMTQIFKKYIYKFCEDFL